MHDKPDIAALIGSRICHDLISPIGAIGNGVELLMLESRDQGPEMALISDSVAQANARIRFFRIAFGAASPGQRIGRPEVAEVLAGLTRGGRLVIDWQGPAEMARAEVKLACLLILCMETAMPQGGRITVSHGDGRWALTAEAARLRVDPALWEVLSNPAAPAEIGPAQVHFLLVPEEIRRQTRRLAVETGDGTIRLSF